MIAYIDYIALTWQYLRYYYGGIQMSSTRRPFVKAAGAFGKRLYRGMVYLGENVTAFIALTLVIVGLFLVASAFGFSVPVMAAAASAAVTGLAELPLLAATVALAVAIAAPETLKKVYKDCTEWVVAAYKNAVKNWFMPKDFDITEKQLAVKKAKHPKKENEADGDYKYNSLESYKAAKETQYTGYDKKTVDLDVAGNAGKRTFKAAANGLADGTAWLASMPGRVVSSLPSFSSFRATSHSETKEPEDGANHSRKSSIFYSQ